MQIVCLYRRSDAETLSPPAPLPTIKAQPSARKLVTFRSHSRLVPITMSQPQGTPNTTGNGASGHSEGPFRPRGPPRGHVNQQPPIKQSKK
ncbi:hypothetical protein SISSUDRAFT_1131359 [Sistotremastrum suecicum HHB10207 ss-3]|uniref:Uncharacterized protein n=1 Tax=Sistotremastrum suecicum HHB10207 ss-3 TaxID=1314776 RepID=A0A166A9T5_9AGAM|nr:hypothetical protein SISSUDRAFT_1131359 [Sistotremastrum suecicum HHB10207 ss-3]